MSSKAADAVAPTIETERLRLRAVRPDDIDAACRMWADPIVYRFTGGAPRPREEVWRRLLANAGTWALFGYGSWAIEDRREGAFLGQIGFLEAMREMAPAFGPGEIEAGWALSPLAHGRGVASEALGAALDWSDKRLPGRIVVCIISPDNAASLRIAARFGFRERLRASYHGQPTIVFERRCEGRSA